MARLRTTLGRAAGLHRQAAAIAAAGRKVLDEPGPGPTYAGEQHEQVDLLRAAATQLAPGWLGAMLTEAASTPLGGHDMPPYVRVGTAQPLDDARFPVIVPLLTHGHLTLDADAREPRVAGMLRSLVLRLLAAAPAGTLRVPVVDATGTVFRRFNSLSGTALMPPPVTDRAGLQAVLAEAEQRVRVATGGHRHPARDRLLLLVVACLPESTDAQDLSRIVALAQAGPAAGLHLVVAGWPPPLAGSTHEPLPLAATVSVGDPYVDVVPPPAAGSAPAPGAGSLDCPVVLDDDPPADLLNHVCRELAVAAEAAARLRLSDLMPDRPEWTGDAGAELATTVGFATDTPVTLRFNDMFPHWMVGGRSGAGKSSFLLNVLLGLATRYGPDELVLFLLDFAEGASFAELASTEGGTAWLPHVRAIGIEPDREYGLAMLRELTAEAQRRASAYERAGVNKFAGARGAGIRMPRILCVIDEFPMLCEATDPVATEAVTLLTGLARQGRSCGIHLMLASQRARSVVALHARRDALFGQVPVRIALPGGGDVLDPSNEAAAGIPVGAAVVNTAGGFGGPRRATRGHETTVHFPDPYAEPDALAALRQRLIGARPVDQLPTHVFVGRAEQHLADDPTFVGIAPTTRPSALLGRMIDVELSTATYPLDATPGRHLAVLGPSGAAIGLLEAATRSVAAQHIPGSARFLLVPSAPDTPEVVARLAADLGAQGHQVSTLTGPTALEAFGHGGEPAYLVIFGADTADLEGPALRVALRDGPTQGRHVFGWWRGLRRFTEHVGPAVSQMVAGLVFLNVPGADVAAMLGRPVDWRSRPHRALLHDWHADVTAVFVPFARSAGKVEVPA